MHKLSCFNPITCSLAGEFFPEAAQIAYKMWELSAMTRVQVWAPAAPTLDVSRMFGSVVACISIGPLAPAISRRCIRRGHAQWKLCATGDLDQNAVWLNTNSCDSHRPCLHCFVQGVNVRRISAFCPNNGSSHSDWGAIFLTTHHHCDC